MKHALLILTFLCLVGALAFGSEAAPARDLSEISTWELVQEGGWVMIPIALCSLITLAYSAERFLNLRHSIIMPKTFVTKLEALLKERKLTEAEALCREDQSPFALIMEAGLREADEDWNLIRKAVEDAGAREIAELRQNVRPLRVVSEISPLLGLFGTIQGMMGAFQNISASAGHAGKTELFAGDIFTALVTTGAGLTVAIPALFLFYHFAGRVDKIVLAMDRKCEELLQAVRRK
ncbi:MAG: MotA/TolQ/ExbB proton channel family protein [Planctomycetota bacterium]